MLEPLHDVIVGIPDPSNHFEFVDISLLVNIFGHGEQAAFEELLIVLIDHYNSGLLHLSVGTEPVNDTKM